MIRKRNIAAAAAVAAAAAALVPAAATAGEISADEAHVTFRGGGESNDLVVEQQIADAGVCGIMWACVTGTWVVVEDRASPLRARQPCVQLSAHAAACAGAGLAYGHLALRLGAGDDRIEMSGRPLSHRTWHVSVDGQDGDDEIRSGFQPIIARGGEGADRLYAASPDPDTFAPADTYLDGGPGDDLLVGGRLGDLFVGGYGDDRLVTAGDDRVDELRCGPGEDVTEHDLRDVVQEDCEG